MSAEESYDGGFELHDQPNERLGWLMNMQPTTIESEDTGGKLAAVEYFFIEQSGALFKVRLHCAPYFYVGCLDGHHTDVDNYLKRRFANVIVDIQMIEKEDLDLPNHLMGIKRTYLKLMFHNVKDLMEIRNEIMPTIERNRKRAASSLWDEEDISRAEAHEYMVDIREYDIPYVVRVSIDRNIRCGYWYTVQTVEGTTSITHRPDLLERGEPVIVAFDIECTKEALKFPDSRTDSVMMISYMAGGATRKKGFLIVNREIVKADIANFQYTPKPEYEGDFEVMNMPNEEELLRRWIAHMKEIKATIYVTFNGDFFDWPFIEARCTVFGIDLRKELGFYKNQAGEFLSRHSPHLDAFKWVKRDSYLPQGSQGLKAVTKYKLGYDPLEIDPEDMTPFAESRPQLLANYSVSDAVATFYLYMKYVHPFIFSLCTIIPMPPDDVLRKGSGTLCESLLTVRAYELNIICPNKSKKELLKLHKGRLLDSETYIGGHVECLASGVFRSDLRVRFRLDPTAFEELKRNVERDLRFAIVEENKVNLDDVTNFDEVRDEIIQRLEALRDQPNREEKPMIYHLDVAAMYPNIILTNRLQPPSIVDQATCAACDFNRSDSRCQRRMQWIWRGEMYNATRGEYERIRSQMESESFPGASPGDPPRRFLDLDEEERAAKLKKRLGEYCRRAYKKAKETRLETREAIVCMRENTFYVGTVMAFRDRRYIYKGKLKEWQRKMGDATKSGQETAIKQAANMLVLYDSLQLAHKCILNSFYGYVMRTGARWHSMEMAGIVTHTGANIIKQARQLIERIGKPLELDTDGVWCCLPASFPENFEIRTSNPKKPKFPISYPCVMLNADVHAHFMNDQYHDLVNEETHEYTCRSECSIFFEVDGPYRAMILPAAKEEGKVLKKRYAVFNHNGTLAELKGFELKRRGELKLIKIFQSEVFEKFLEGMTLEECYQAVGEVGNRWLDMLDTQGEGVMDEELLEYISESRSMSQALSAYAGQKSTSITTARRLAEFLGDDMVRDAGLTCNFIISRQPVGSQVTERAIPLAIFSAEPVKRRYFLHKWLNDKSLSDAELDIRAVLDWNYYKERLGSAIQKIITIPAAMQRVSTPCPRVLHPDWLQKRLREEDPTHRQQTLDSLWGPLQRPQAQETPDLEDLVGRPAPAEETAVVRHKRPPSRPPGWESCPPKENFGEWLRFQQALWRHQRFERTRMRLDDGDEEEEEAQARSKRGRGPRVNPFAETPDNPIAGPLGSFLTLRATSIMYEPWHILQITETYTPTQLRMWVLARGTLLSIQLTVPYLLYVNTRNPALVANLNVPSRQVVHVLPREQQIYSLYELQVDRMDHEWINTLRSSPDVAGVFESKIAPVFRAIEALGCCCRVRPASRKKNMRSTFTLQDFDMLQEQDCPYLPPPARSKGAPMPCPASLPLLPRGLHAAYVYHARQGDRGVYGLYCSSTHTLHVILVNPHQRAQAPNLQRLFARQLAENFPAHPDGPHAPPRTAVPAVAQYVVRDFENAAQRLTRLINDLQIAQNKPYLFCLQSAGLTRPLAEEVPALRELPCFELPSSHADVSQPWPALEWMTAAARICAERFVHLGTSLPDVIGHARYAQIPLGNCQGDIPLLLSDIMMARALRRSNAQHLLWYSESRRPDLGGLEDDDLVLAGELCRNPEVVHAGSFHTFSVDLDLLSLGVDAVLQSEHLCSLNDTDFLDFDISAPHLMTDYNDKRIQSSQQANAAPGSSFQLPVASGVSQNCGSAFRILKSLLLNWYTDVVRHHDPHADNLMMHFYRWVSSPQSRLYDPALHHMVHLLMRKVLVQLLHTIKRLGSTVVYASFNRLIINTNKDSPSAILDHVRNLRQALHAQDLFHFLVLEPNRYWASLLYLDPANYGGFWAPAPGAMPDGQGEVMPALPDTKDFHLDSSNWNLAQYLHRDTRNPRRSSQSQSHKGTELNPRDLQHSFVIFISMFLLKPFKLLLREAQSGPQRAFVSVKERQQRIETAVTTCFTGSAHTHEHEHARAQEHTTGNDSLASMLYKLVDLTHKTVSSGEAPPFPMFQQTPSGQEPSRHMRSLMPAFLRNPALAFVNCICHVLELETCIQDSVMRLKKNLLRLIDIQEFSGETSFINPGLTFVLPDIVCSYCNSCRDMDLCRDPDLLAGQWTCRSCGHRYDCEMIENMLVEYANREVLAYQTQDLRCVKCRQVKNTNLSQTCECSHGFETTVSEKSLLTRLKILHAIGCHHSMDYLTETTEWLLANGDA